MTDERSPEEIPEAEPIESGAGETVSGTEETVSSAAEAMSGADDTASGGEGGAQLGSFIEHPSGFRLKDILWATPSWLISTMVHAVVLLALALVTMPPGSVDELRQLIASTDELDELDVLEDFEDNVLEEIDLSTSEMTFDTPIMEAADVTFADFDEPAAAISVDLHSSGLEMAPRNDLLADIGSFTGDAMSGRGKAKKSLVRAAGGSDASEKAVVEALKWLARHQLPDGSWSFDHTLHKECAGQCGNPGELAAARNGATAMALLPFLGAGQTHMEGEYQPQVRAGLAYLVNKMKLEPGKGGSLFEGGGSMYSHGLAAITLCEAWGMTQDEALKVPAQQSLLFICWAQDPVAGGWRYAPRKGGDTSVVGWQIMALKSGHMSYLMVPPIVVKKAYRYLDTVQANDGSHYGYTSPAQGQATTAIGLLCRMHLGWKKDNPALQRGIKWISDQGPSKSNAYYNYYATQVMRHNEGELWDKWNKVMRDQLVKSQVTAGHAKGSWAAPGSGHTAVRGGRLYETSMSTMVLEVYYRHMPIYRKQSTESDFPLD